MEPRDLLEAANMGTTFVLGVAVGGLIMAWLLMVAIQ
jgi:hypothetical protein